MEVGKVSNYQKGFLYFVAGDGSVFRMPPRGKTGAKTKVGQVQRPASSMCWVDGQGKVQCKKR